MGRERVWDLLSRYDENITAMNNNADFLEKSVERSRGRKVVREKIPQEYDSRAKGLSSSLKQTFLRQLL